MKLVVILLSLSSFAHLKMGDYFGKTDQGDECSVEIISKEYQDNIHHPLNEKVLARFEKNIFELNHPHVFNKEDSKIGFIHKYLRGAKGTKVSSMVLEIEMVHTQTKKGPDSFIFLENGNEDNRVNCHNLIFRGEK